MEFLSLAVQKLLDFTLAPIARQVGFVIFYSSNVKELKKEAEGLQRARGRVQHEIEAAQRNGELIEQDVLNWLEEVDKIVVKVDELNKDEHHTKIGCSIRSFSNMSSRHKLSRHSKKMMAEIIQIKSRRNFDRVAYREIPKFIGPSSSTTYSMQLGSRVSIQNEIMEALADPNVHTIGVHGLPGVGKTTLLEKVSQKVQQDKLFDVVVFANVTQDLDLGKIQQQIADMLELKFKEQTLSVRACRLRDRLSLNQQTVLVILDDLWAELNMDEIGIPSIEQHKCLKVLMTSRSREVLFNQMNVQKNFLLPVLPKQEAWKLFTNKAHFDESAVSEEFLLIATEVVEECAGLPVAIVTIASALRNKSLLEWKDALRQFQNLAPENITGMQEKVYKSIKLSYDKLDNDLLKSIFLLCGVMPSHSLVMDLLNNSIGLGLFKDIYNMEEAQNSLQTCIRKLKDLYLLLDGYSINRFHMHDVVKDAAIYLASKQQNLFIKRYEKLEEWPEGYQLNNCRTIILDCSDIDELPDGLYFPNLTFFHLHNNKPIQIVADKFFNGMCELKVLNLTGEILNSLPSSISFLSNLRTLCLNVRGDIGIIGELKGLKVLTLNSDVSQLPSKLCQLMHLQLLDLRGCYNLVLIPPNILSGLTKLQELYIATHIYSNPIQWYVDNEDYNQLSNEYRGKDVFDSASNPNNQQSKASLFELNNLVRLTTLEVHIRNEKMLPKDVVFERLRRYKIIIGSEPNLSFEYETSRMLKLDLSTSIHSWGNVKRLLDTVEDLHMYNLKGAENIIPGINEEGMPQLKHLHLHFSDKIQTIIDTSRWNHPIDIFPNLESLVIDYATNLEKLCTGFLTRRSLSRLKVLNVANCGQMETFFSVSTVTGSQQSSLVEETTSDNGNAIGMLQFGKLQTLILQGLPQLISFWNEGKIDCSVQQEQLMSTHVDSKIVTKDNIADNPISLFNEKVLLPNLEEMIISYMLKLNMLWHLQQQLCSKSFDRLRKLEIENCQELMIVFPSSIGSSMHNLEKLFITNCESLEHVFDLQGLYSKEENSEISSLSGALSFPNLQQVYIERCEKLKHLFPVLVAKTLRKLQRLKIEKCWMMEEIIIKEEITNPSSSEEVIFPNLEDMIIADADNLKAILDRQQHLATNSFGRLKSIEIKNCPKLVYILPSSIMKVVESTATFTIVDCESLHLMQSWRSKS